MASSKGARVFGILVLLACLGVVAGGGWYFFGRDYFASDDDTADDDEPDDTAPATDGGVPKKGGHHAGKHHGKSGGKKAGGGAVHAAPAARPTGPGGKTYEAAIAGNNEQKTIGGPAGSPDLTEAQLGGPMRNASFIGGCGAPDSMHVTVKVAIKMGRPAGVSVYTTPPDAEVAGCVDRAVRNLAWPVNAKMDSFVTTY